MARYKITEFVVEALKNSPWGLVDEDEIDFGEVERVLDQAMIGVEYDPDNIRGEQPGWFDAGSGM